MVIIDITYIHNKEKDILSLYTVPATGSEVVPTRFLPLGQKTRLHSEPSRTGLMTTEAVVPLYSLKRED